MRMRKDFPNFLRFLEKRLGGRIELAYQGKEQTPPGSNEPYTSSVIHRRPNGDRYELGTLTMVYEVDGDLVRKEYDGKIPSVKKKSASLSFEAPSHMAPWGMVVHETEKPWERNDELPNIPFP